METKNIIFEFLLICSYEEEGESPEIVIYKKR